MGYFFAGIMFLIAFLNGIAKKTSIFLHLKKRASIIVVNTIIYSMALAGTSWVGAKIIRIMISWYEMTV